MHDSPVWSSPVLRSVRGVVERSLHVRTSVEAIEQVASWMAYEEFTFPSGAVDGAISDRSDPAEIIDVSFFYAVMNFAFTDFDSGVKFAAEYGGRTWSDSEGMFACVAQALDDGVPLTDGAYLAEISRAELGRVFSGNIEIPMLDERVEILNAAGQVSGRALRRQCSPVRRRLCARHVRRGQWSVGAARGGVPPVQRRQHPRWP